MKKEIGLIGLMLMSFIMMFDTKYLRAPGDYLLGAIGLKAWTGHMSGIHLTVVYFGILFIVSLVLIEKHIVQTNIMKWKKVCLLLGIGTCAYVVIGSTSVQLVMRNSDTITSIEYQSEIGHLDFQKEEDVFTDFKIDFKLYNYSKEERLFFIDIDSSWRREDGKPPIQIFDSNGERAVFYLSGEEERVFHLTEADYQLSDGRREGHYSSNGILDELILTDMEGRFIVLTHDKSYNLRLSQ